MDGKNAEELELMQKRNVEVILHNFYEDRVHKGNIAKLQEYLNDGYEIDHYAGAPIGGVVFHSFILIRDNETITGDNGVGDENNGE